LSKIETGKLQLNSIEYDIPSLINDTIQLNIIRIGSKPIEFILEIDESLPSRLLGDELRLKQILNNLLSNAIKYTEKGHVKLAVNHAVENGNIVLYFVVEDTGQGMKLEDRQKFFSEYQRFNTETNRSTEGTGLGLNITKKLVEMMDGTIWAESEYGHGSVFLVSVRQKPVKCPAIGAVLASKLRNFTFTSDRRAAELLVIREPMPYGKVLIVDDVETNLYVAEGLISSYQIKVETATSGFIAIEKTSDGNTYDIIFMDHMMPQMDGIETTEKLRELGYAGTIVALTANALVGNDEMFMQKGFDGFIAKPIDIRQLDSILNKFIRDKYPQEAIKYKHEKKSTQTETDLINHKLIQVFRRDAQKAVVTLRETAAGGDIKLFTITVHAMKSALGNVGEHTIATQAAALENAGLRYDTDFIAANTEAFLQTLETLIRTLAPDETAGTNTSDLTEDTDYLKKQLEIVRTACGNYDVNGAYAALDELKKKQWKVQTTAFLEKIHDLLYLDSDFDAVVEMIENFS
jgi:CheY-like chemotaxis protein/anti-sigma regulatory factor (Ser/Thr protein kinase)